MPRQFGPIKLQGTIGDITFHRNPDGSFGAKAKSSLNAERLATDPAFIRARENGAQFGRAGKGGKLFRSAFPAATIMGDRLLITRLHKLMMRVIKSDAASVRGQKQISLGDLNLIKDFDFNADGKLSVVFKNRFTTSLARTTGVAKIDVPAYNPEGTIFPPGGATHYKLFTTAAEVDFDNNLSVSETIESGYLPLNNVATVPLSLSVTLTPTTTLPVFQALGIRFYQEDNGVKYALNNSAADAVSVVGVDV
jgi:hypothetical protein